MKTNSRTLITAVALSLLPIILTACTGGPSRATPITSSSAPQLTMPGMTTPDMTTPDMTTTDPQSTDPLASMVPADAATSCSSAAPALYASTNALECHLGLPQTVYFWHFGSRTDMEAALLQLNSNAGSNQVPDPTKNGCNEISTGSMNATGTYERQDGSVGGSFICPDSSPSDPAYIYQISGGFLAWTEDKAFNIGLIYDPYFTEMDRYSWWVAEYHPTNIQLVN